MKIQNQNLLKKEKKEQADKKISKPKEDKKVEKKPQIKDKKDPSKVTELVLPNLNLKFIRFKTLTFLFAIKVFVRLDNSIKLFIF